MMKLMFYRGPGNIITRIIRFLTRGPYSHVEMQFTNGRRFFASGHGVFQGSNMIHDHRIYNSSWDSVLIPATEEQEKSVQRYAFSLIGTPFDMNGMVRFTLPGGARRKYRYCSAVIMEVLQNALHMFPGESLKISPNGLHRLFLSHKHVLTCDCMQDDTVAQDVDSERLKQSLAGPGSLTGDVFAFHPERREGAR